MGSIKVLEQGFGILVEGFSTCQFPSIVVRQGNELLSSLHVPSVPSCVNLLETGLFVWAGEDRVDYSLTQLSYLTTVELKVGCRKVILV